MAYVGQLCRNSCLLNTCVDAVKLRYAPSPAFPATTAPRAQVTYCTLGFRAAKFARKLIAEEFDNVRDLEGSILGWTQHGFDLETRGHQPTRRVHVYSESKLGWVGEGYEPVTPGSQSVLGSIKGVLRLIRGT